MPPPAEVEVSRLPVFAIGAGGRRRGDCSECHQRGMITPILMGEGVGMPAGAAVPATAASVAAPDVAATSAAMVATHAGIIVVGGAIGAAIGNWLSNGN